MSCPRSFVALAFVGLALAVAGENNGNATRPATQERPDKTTGAGVTRAPKEDTEDATKAQTNATRAAKPTGDAGEAGKDKATEAPKEDTTTGTGCQESGGTYGIKTKGKSGKFEFFDERCGKGKKGSKKVEVEVDSISEVDKDGNKV